MEIGFGGKGPRSGVIKLEFSYLSDIKQGRLARPRMFIHLWSEDIISLPCLPLRITWHHIVLKPQLHSGLTWGVLKSMRARSQPQEIAIDWSGVQQDIGVFFTLHRWFMCAAKAVNPWFGRWLGNRFVNLFTRVSRCFRLCNFFFLFHHNFKYFALKKYPAHPWISHLYYIGSCWWIFAAFVNVHPYKF